MTTAATSDPTANGFGADRRALRVLLDHLPVFVYHSRLEADGAVLEFVSDGVQTVTGYPVADFVERRTQSPLTLIEPDDQVRLVDAIRRAVLARRPFEVEYRIRTATGDPRWLLDKGVGIYQGETPVAIEGMATDITALKLTEQALRDSRDEYTALFEAHHDALFVADVENGILLDVNPAACRLMHLPKERLIGQHFSALHPGDQAELTRQHFRSQAGGNLKPITTEVLTGDGRRVPVRITPSTLAFRGGRRVLQGCFHDLSEARAAELAVRASTRRYRQLFEVESDAILVIDQASQCILDANQAAERLYGYARDELLTRRSLDLDAPPPERATEIGAREGTVPIRYQRRRDGTVFPAEIGASFFEEGTRTLHIAVVRDISARVAAEQALRESGRQMQALVNNLPGFAFRGRLDAGRTMDYLSDGVELLTGFPARELVGTRGRTFASIIDPADHEAMARDIGRALETRQPYVVEYRVQTRHGERRWFWEKGSGVFQGEVLVGIEGFVTDITGRRQAEAERQALQAQLLQAQKMESVGRLAGGIAHDFNNLLTVILGYCDMMIEESASPEVQNDLTQIRIAGERARVLTRQLLAFGRKQLLELRRINLNRVILDYGTMLKRLIGEHIAVQTVLDPELGDINGDAAQLAQIIVNLAINARDAMPGGGVLTIGTKNLEVTGDPNAPAPGPAPGPYVLVQVTDTGCGMDSDTRKRVFEPFFTTKEVGKGSGLGLAVAYGIIKQHGGYIDFTSRPGEGTTFRLYLPRPELAPAPVAAAAAATPTRPHGHESILLVEDDAGVRAMAQAFLTRYGYRVMAAETPTSALRLAALADHLDLLLVDVIMPEMNGRDLYGKVAAIKPGIKVLYTSGYAQDVLSRRGSLDEGLHFLPKPFTADLLASKVREALGETAAPDPEPTPNGNPA